jgi:hypothetical protein
MMGIDGRPIDCSSRCSGDEHVVMHRDHFKAGMCRQSPGAYRTAITRTHFVGDVRRRLSV